MTTTNISGTATNYTSPKGHTYTASTVNAGSGFKVTNGASSVKFARGRNYFSLTGAMANNTTLSMHGVLANSTIYAKSTGGFNGTVTITPSQTTGTVAAGAQYGGTGISLGKITGGGFEYTAVRKPNENTWLFFIRFNAQGIAAAIDYSVVCSATDANTIPTPYCGGTGSLGSSTNCALEVLEEN